MKLTRRIANKQVTIHGADDLKPQAEALLDKLAELDAKGPALHAGSVIDFGWSRLTLEAEGDELVVSEPDFLSDPTKRTSTGVEATLRISLRQAELLQRLGVEGVDARWDSTLALQRGALSTARVYLERMESQNPGFSGWYLGEVRDSGPVERKDVESMPVYRLYTERPELLTALALPPGWLVVFDGQIIEAALNPAGENVWEKAQS
jgi:hypothetical protein